MKTLARVLGARPGRSPQNSRCEGRTLPDLSGLPGLNRPIGLLSNAPLGGKRRTPAWAIGSARVKLVDPPMGALDELLGATELTLDEATMTRLDEAGQVELSTMDIKA